MKVTELKNAEFPTCLNKCRCQLCSHQRTMDQWLCHTGVHNVYCFWTTYHRHVDCNGVCLRSSNSVVVAVHGARNMKSDLTCKYLQIECNWTLTFSVCSMMLTLQKVVCKLELNICVGSTVCTYIRHSSWNLKSNTVERDQTQQDHYTAYLTPCDILPPPLFLCAFVPTRKTLPHILKKMLLLQFFSL